MDGTKGGLHSLAHQLFGVTPQITQPWGKFSPSPGKGTQLPWLLMGLGWGVLIPAGVMVARYLRGRDDPLWFKLHWRTQAAGSIMAIVGFSLSPTLPWGSQKPQPLLQGLLGLTMLVATVQQIAAGALRPKKGMALRRPWEAVHKAVGHLAIPLAFAHVTWGLMTGPKELLPPWLFAMSAICVVFVTAEMQLWRTTGYKHLGGDFVASFIGVPVTKAGREAQRREQQELRLNPVKAKTS